MTGKSDEKKTEEVKHRTLAEIAADIAKHRKEYPTHGVGCACMDKHAQEIKAQLLTVMPWMYNYSDDITETERLQRWDTKSAVAHVLAMVNRSLNW